MSVIYVQIGQCGNQVGQYFWKEALGIVGNDKRKCEVKSAKHLEYGERLSSLLTYSGKLPLILLDSEAKPARALHASRELGQFIREENVIIDKTGRGGNWAFGYSGGKRGGRKNELLEQATERYRREMERCGRFSGTVVFHSLAGGTGSGEIQFFLRCASVPIVEHVDLAVRFKDCPSPYLTPLSSGWNTQTACFYEVFTVEIVPVGSWYKHRSIVQALDKLAPALSGLHQVGVKIAYHGY